ncbi:MAG: cysteine desulfurase family protein [Acidimicrobiales bacterium]
MARHYLDFASSAPLRPEAQDAIRACLDDGLIGDPSRPHTEGRRAAQAIEAAREALAQLLSVRERQVIFTSSGTEAANWATFAATAAHEGGEIALAGVEHSAVVRSSERHAETIVIPVDRFGRIDVDFLDDLLRTKASRLVLVHCQFANHEVGTLQPVVDVVQRCHDAGVAVHVDACQAIGQMPVDPRTLDADFVSLSGHKFGAPKGVGALIVRSGARVKPMIVGADQERARRAGMEPLLSIVGLGAVAEALGREGALELAAANSRSLTAQIMKSLLQIEGVVAYGDPDGRAPHICCFGIADVEAEGALLGLDQAGIAAHSGSACSSEAVEPSPVLAAMGVDAEHSLRCSVGWSSTDEDAASLIDAFPLVLCRLRSLGDSWR